MPDPPSPAGIAAPPAASMPVGSITACYAHIPPALHTTGGKNCSCYLMTLLYLPANPLTSLPGLPAGCAMIPRLQPCDGSPPITGWLFVPQVSVSIPHVSVRPTQYLYYADTIHIFQ